MHLNLPFKRILRLIEELVFAVLENSYHEFNVTSSLLLIDYLSAEGVS